MLKENPLQKLIDDIFNLDDNKCPMCLGGGKLSIGGKIKNNPIDCPQCNGSGKITDKNKKG
jgi:DnaJ-class molecular chaperone